MLPPQIDEEEQDPEQMQGEESPFPEVENQTDGENLLGTDVGSENLDQTVEDPDSIEIPDEELKFIESDVWSLFQQIRGGDTGARFEGLKECVQLDDYYNGFQQTWWDAGKQRWVRDTSVVNLAPGVMAPSPVKKKKIFNNFQAWVDIIIAALAVSAPKTVFYPEDADNPDDIEASMAYETAADWIKRKNDSWELLAEAIYILGTQHLLAFRNRYDENHEYGTYKKPIIENVEYQNDLTTCAECGADVDPNSITSSDPSLSPSPELPTDTEVNSDEADLASPENTEQVPPEPTESAFCPQCSDMKPVERIPVTNSVEEQTGEEELPKEKEVLECYGDLNITIPIGCECQTDIPWLIFQKEYNVNTLKGKYPKIAEKIQPAVDYTYFDMWARKDANFTQESELFQSTETVIWLRPCSYHEFGEEKRLEYEANFPKGLRATFVGPDLAEVVEECLDKHWTFAKLPTYQYLHFKPFGRDLVPVQDAKNTVRNLTEQTMRHAIRERWADPTIVDFDAYEKTIANPGQLFRAKRRNPDQDLSKAFHESTPATLSKEVEFYDSNLTEDGQFFSGGYPSVFGGIIQGGSQTGKEYELSRAASLQRLTIKWKPVANALVIAIKKGIEDLFENMKRDINFSKRSGNSFINVWIKKSSTAGTVASVDVENSDEFPVSWAQQQERMASLIGMNNENINTAIFDPDNVSLVAKLLGFPDAEIPGEKDRQKQLYEIKILQTEGPNPDGTSSIVPDPFDSNEVHASVTRAWLISPEGLALRQENQEGYANVVAHWQMHNAAIQEQQQQAALAQAQPQPGQNKPPVDKKVV